MFSPLLFSVGCIEAARNAEVFAGDKATTASDRSRCLKGRSYRFWSATQDAPSHHLQVTLSKHFAVVGIAKSVNITNQFVQDMKDMSLTDVKSEEKYRMNLPSRPILVTCPPILSEGSTGGSKRDRQGQNSPDYTYLSLLADLL